MKIFLVLLILSANVYSIDKIEIGVDEQLGSSLPLDVSFKDEEGNDVILKDLITKPTVLAFVYYDCPAICNPLLFELTNVINKSDLETGYDYNVISISIDDLETPNLASEKKLTFYSAIDADISKESWRFLTGSKENIKKVADAAGFYYKREGVEFRHAGTLIFVDQTGKICRYLVPGYSDKRGFGILPFDFKMAVLETSKGNESPTIARVLQFCFSYDPEGKSYALNFTRIFGVGILLFVGIFLLVVKLKPKKESIKAR